MRNTLFIIALCFLGSSASALDTLRYNESITRQLILQFNEKSKELDSYITWQLRGDGWDNVDITVNQGSLRGDRFTLRAREYQAFADDKDGIAITITPLRRIEEGSYRFRLETIEVSPDLRFIESDLNLDDELYLIPLPPKPWWLILLYWVVPILLILLFLFVFWHNCKTFKKGIIQLNIVGQAPVQIELQGKKNVSLSKELAHRNINLKGDMLITKKCIGYFDRLIIKKLVDYDALMRGKADFLSAGDDILAGERVTGLKTNDDNNITLIFTI